MLSHNQQSSYRWKKEKEEYVHNLNLTMSNRGFIRNQRHTLRNRDPKLIFYREITLIQVEKVIREQRSKRGKKKREKMCVRERKT